MNDKIKTIQDGIKELEQISNKGDTVEFMKMVARILDGMNYKLEKVAQEVLPANAFIDPSDIPTRLR